MSFLSTDRQSFRNKVSIFLPEWSETETTPLIADWDVLCRNLRLIIQTDTDRSPSTRSTSRHVLASRRITEQRIGRVIVSLMGWAANETMRIITVIRHGFIPQSRAAECSSSSNNNNNSQGYSADDRWISHMRGHRPIVPPTLLYTSGSLPCSILRPDRKCHITSASRLADQKYVTNCLYYTACLPLSTTCSLNALKRYNGKP